MNANQLENSTKSFSIMILDLTEQLPNTISGKVVANQMVRSGTSVGANYRAVCRARSDREFISKMNIVLEESDETLFWLELIETKKWLDTNNLLPAITEANALTSIFVSSLKTMNSKMGK